MVKKLIKHGKSLGIIIDKPILELLKIDEKTELEIKTDGKNIMIEPRKLNTSNQSSSSKTSSHKRLLKKYLDEAIEQYGPALKKLAKK